jgi:hypothetical protein
VSIRPERVEFKPEMMPPGAHTLEAEVLEFIYMGDIFRTRLRVAGEDDFVLKIAQHPRADAGWNRARKSASAGRRRMRARWTRPDDPPARGQPQRTKHGRLR